MRVDVYLHVHYCFYSAITSRPLRNPYDQRLQSLNRPNFNSLCYLPRYFPGPPLCPPQVTCDPPHFLVKCHSCPPSIGTGCTPPDISCCSFLVNHEQKESDRTQSSHRRRRKASSLLPEQRPGKLTCNSQKKGGGLSSSGPVIVSSSGSESCLFQSHDLHVGRFSPQHIHESLIACQ